MHVSTQKNIEIKSPAAKFFFSRIFPLIFLAVGIGLFYKGYTDMELAKESVNWPDVEGKITSSEVISETSRDSKKRNSTTYTAHIKYTYVVSDIPHTGDNVSFGDYGSGNSGHAEEIVRKYPVGEKVKVYYRPEDHTLAVLETGIKGGTWVMPIVGVVFILAGIIMMFAMPKAMNKKEEKKTALEEMQN